MAIKCMICGTIFESAPGVNEAVCPQCETKQAVAGRSNMAVPTDAMLKHVQLFLTSGNFVEADNYLNKILAANPTCAEAYVGKLMVQCRCRKQKDLKNCQAPFDHNENYRMAIRYGDRKLAKTLASYIFYILARNKKDAMAIKKKSPMKKIAIITVPILCLVIAFVVVLNTGVFDSPEEKQYKAAVQLMNEGKTAEAAIAFGKMGDYKDANDKSFELWRQVIPNEEMISAGEEHTVGLKKDGTVVATEIDIREGDWELKQNDVSDWRDIVSVSADAFHTVGLRQDGTVVATGDNGCGRCDVISWNNIVAISTGSNHTVGLKKNGTVCATVLVDSAPGVKSVMDNHGVDEYNFGQSDVSGWRDIVAISAGDLHTVGLKKDGTVVAVGYNLSGQCEIQEWRDIVAISAGRFHTVGLKKDGTVVTTKLLESSWEYGQCDVEEWRDIIAISAGRFHTVGLKSDGTVVAVGENNDQCDVDDWCDIVSISANDDYTVGLKKDGTLVAVGKNYKGRCDVDDWKDIATSRKEIKPYNERA